MLTYAAARITLSDMKRVEKRIRLRGTRIESEKNGPKNLSKRCDNFCARFISLYFFFRLIVHSFFPVLSHRDIIRLLAECADFAIE